MYITHVLTNSIIHKQVLLKLSHKRDGQAYLYFIATVESHTYMHVTPKILISVWSLVFNSHTARLH